MTTVIVVDDHQFVRQSVVKVVDAEDGFEVEGFVPKTSSAEDWTHDAAGIDLFMVGDQHAPAAGVPGAGGAGRLGGNGVGSSAVSGGPGGAFPPAHGPPGSLPKNS